MKTRIIYGLLAGLFMWLYWLTWEGAVLFLIIIGGFLWVQFIIFGLRRMQYLGFILLGLFCLTIGLILYDFPGRIFPLLVTGQAKLGSAELVSLNLLSAYQNFGLITFLIPIALALLIYWVVKRGDASLTLLLAWSLVILVTMLVYRRFAYYFAINASLLTGWFIWYVWGKLYKVDLTKAIAITALLCGLVVFPNIPQATARYAYNTPSDAWCETLDWIEGNTPKDSIILAWWDYGHWIERMGGRESYVSGGKRSIGVAKMFLSPSENSTIDFDYLILDYATITSKFKGITIWADLPIKLYSFEYNQSMAVRLYNGELGQYALVYQADDVKVFYKRKIIDGQ